MVSQRDKRQESSTGDRRIVVLVSQRVRRQENSPGDRRLVVLVSQRVRRQENSRLVESEITGTKE